MTCYVIDVNNPVIYFVSSVGFQALVVLRQFAVFCLRPQPRRQLPVPVVAADDGTLCRDGEDGEESLHSVTYIVSHGMVLSLYQTAV